MKLSNEEVNTIRDAAIKIEKDDVFLALKLMHIARKYRSNGPLINKKIKRYKEKSEYINSRLLSVKEKIASGRLAIIPLGFRCYTSQVLDSKFGIKQASLPFDSGYFPPDAIAKIIDTGFVELKYPEGEENHLVLTKIEGKYDPLIGKGIQFYRSNYASINDCVISRDQKNLNYYLDATFGYYTYDVRNGYVLAHYNWHGFASIEKSSGICDPEINLPICRVPDDRISQRSYPLLASRELIKQLIQEKLHGHQAA